MGPSSSSPAQATRKIHTTGAVQAVADSISHDLDWFAPWHLSNLHEEEKHEFFIPLIIDGKKRDVEIKKNYA